MTFIVVGGDTIFFKKVIDRVDEVPKNYTIIFKYLSGKVSPLMSYFEVDVNVSILLCLTVLIRQI